MVLQIWWIALFTAIVTGSKIYIMLDQYASSWNLKQFTVSTITTLSRKSFHMSTTLKLKELCIRAISKLVTPAILSLEQAC